MSPSLTANKLSDAFIESINSERWG
jgi:hypothetical protein